MSSALTSTTSTVVPATATVFFMVKSILVSRRTTWNILMPLTKTSVAPVRPPYGLMMLTVEVVTGP
ncbi:MAG: hypothetical protein NTZ50_16105 [Chloroflexi bacterium]|nr:hypothetical protein [Chloroflexota bacterium]